ncbi:MAG: ATP-dependent Clp protease proteolytic subunit, partial [Muribaculaceae bacterium]|nr:ATP-dependent Clp protease proteolytic subunit [Muribaculaceae bacterium]
IGCVASMGFAILSAGEKGHRYALPSARIMCHQSSGGAVGNIQDARANFKAWERLNQYLAELIAKNCGMPVEEYLKAAERDNYLWPEEAKKFGVIDDIFYGAIGAPVPAQPKKKAAVAKKA